MMPHEGDDDAGLLLVEPHHWRKTSTELRPDDTVIAAARLSDVVQQCSHEEEVGAIDRSRERARLDRGLDEVAVDSEPMDSIALRRRPDSLPTGQQARDDACLIHRLPDPDCRGAGAEEGDEGLPRGARPRTRQRCALRGKSLHRDRCERESGLGRSRRGSQGERRIPVGTRLRREDHLPRLDDNPLGKRHPVASGPPDLPQRESRSLARQSGHAMPRGVRRIGNRPR